MNHSGTPAVAGFPRFTLTYDGNTVYYTVPSVRKTTNRG